MDEQIYYAKVRFLTGGCPSKQAYTYASHEPLAAGDKVQINSNSVGIVDSAVVDMGWVKSYGNDKIKFIHGKVKEVSDDTSGKRD